MTIVTNGTDNGDLPPRSRIRRRITGRVKLAGLDGHDLTRRIQTVTDYPPGVALDYVTRFGAHLATLEIQCSDPDTATAWDQALDDTAEVSW